MEFKLNYDRELTIEAKNRIGKFGKISEIWHNNFAPSNVIGNCTDLFRKLNPTSEKDFFEKYFKYAEENTEKLNIRERGIVYKDFLSLIENYRTMANSNSGENFNFETYYYDALCHIITETYDGKINEINFMNYLKNLGYNVSFFSGYVDTKYGVDIKIDTDNGNKRAIQIKPLSFFKSKREDVHFDRIQLVKKYHNFLKDFGYKTDYAIYYKDRNNDKVFWLKNNDGYRFTIDELFQYDNNDLENTLVVQNLDNKEFVSTL